MPPDKKKEIIEHDVHKVVVQADYYARNKQYKPVNGWVKWFVDDIGQTWCKFSTSITNKPEIMQHVIPASRVVEVQYLKNP
jgi:hypothetical protein